MAMITCHICDGYLDESALVGHLLARHDDQWPPVLDDIPESDREAAARRAVYLCWGSEPHGLNLDEVVCSRHLVEARNQLTATMTKETRWS